MAKNRLAKIVTGRADVPSPATAACKPSAREQAERRRYQAEDALRTITRAEEIRRDTTLMRDVKACAREQARTLDCVLGKKSKPSGRR